MKFTVLTLFPSFLSSFADTSIIKRAILKHNIDLEIVDFRAFSNNKHHHVDAKPYGGGAGMLLQVGPITSALNTYKKDNSYVLLTSPKAQPLKQKDLIRLSTKEHIIVICGHYEGFDARVERFVDEHISIGDYILTGGELASMVLIDGITRLLKGSINAESLASESYDNNLLEYPQYTKPFLYDKQAVPSILVSGNHEAIKRWRQKMALKETLRYRPDLLKNKSLSSEEKHLLKEIYEELLVK